MALESPLKKETEAATKLLDQTNKAYQKYFFAMEKLPPLDLRKDLDKAIAKLRTEMNKIHQTGARFLITSLIAKYHTHCGQWDKIMKDIEEGRYHRQPRRI